MDNRKIGIKTGETKINAHENLIDVILVGGN
jgi:hypothetical protein